MTAKHIVYFVFAVLYIMDQVFYNQSKNIDISVLCLCGRWRMRAYSMSFMV